MFSIWRFVPGPTMSSYILIMALMRSIAVFASFAKKTGAVRSGIDMTAASLDSIKYKNLRDVPCLGREEANLGPLSCLCLLLPQCFSVISLSLSLLLSHALVAQVLNLQTRFFFFLIVLAEMIMDQIPDILELAWIDAKRPFLQSRCLKPKAHNKTTLTLYFYIK